MTREEAIKELEEDKALYMPEEWIESLDRDTPDGRLITALDMAIEVLKQEPKWIPVSERLPEDRREVLVTAYWHETYQVMIASYYGDDLWWCVPFNNCGEHMQRLKPKAWMPLPTPYRMEVVENENSD